MYTKNDFLEFWGTRGYIENFDYYKDFSFTREKLYETIVKPFHDINHICLEIGPGGGIWTNQLIENFKHVIAIDVIPRSPLLKEKILYYELQDFDYKCSPIEDDSIDFVFCFGVFCHLPNSAQKEYIKNIKRILKKDGNAILMFADWETHPFLNKDLDKKENYRENAHNMGWFFMDKETIIKIMDENEITYYQDLVPEIKDRIIHIKK